MASKCIMDLSKLKSANIRSKCLIFGFVRDAELTMSFFMNIPELIPWIILSYFYVFEYFDVIGKDIQLSDDTMSVTKINTRSWRNTSYGAIIIPSNTDGVYRWDLELVHLGENYKLLIGIKSGPICNDSPFVRRTHGSKYYGYYCKNGRIYKHSTVSTPYSQNITYKAGDIISIQLNLKKKQIRFMINDKDLSASTVDVDTGHDINYRLTVSMQELNMSVKIIHFEHIN